VELVSRRFQEAEDGRAAGKVQYPLPDVLMSGLAMMSFQHPSLLAFQRTMERRRGQSNRQRVFQLNAIPSDTPMREILDPLAPEVIRGVFKPTFERRRQGQQ